MRKPSTARQVPAAVHMAGMTVGALVETHSGDGMGRQFRVRVRVRVRVRGPRVSLCIRLAGSTFRRRSMPVPATLR